MSIENNNSDLMLNFNPNNVKRISNLRKSKVHHITLEPGECLDKFITCVKTVFYVHEGWGIGLFNKDKVQIEPGRFLDCSSNTSCQFFNNGQCLLSFFIIQVTD